MDDMTLTLQPYYANNLFSEYWKVWIDYNRDGDFEDAGEEAVSIYRELVP
ncbi:MAG: GEVED domain-containing protein [Saprospiraceae bacterium]